MSQKRIAHTKRLAEEAIARLERVLADHKAWLEAEAK